MNGGMLAFRNGRIFDGTRLHDDAVLRIGGGLSPEILPASRASPGDEAVDLKGDILSPGYTDLQVNGGDGLLLNDDPSVDTVRRIAAAHGRLGAASLLPTLITDTREKTRSAIDAVRGAIRAGIPEIAGLHLEGPHLSQVRKGAHDPELIRPMEAHDLEMLLNAAAELPLLKVTLAPESVTEDQVAALVRAGVLVSLGHSDAGFDTCLRYAAAGARCVTHLFNAMSQLGHREPGLVGAALASGGLSAGLIADAIHVHPEAMRVAWAAKTRPGRIYLVSDAMAVAGTHRTEFRLGGRRIRRADGRLTLDDGTLAGADLDLTTAVRTLVERVGVELEDALAAATSVPATLIGRPPGLHPGVGTDGRGLIRIAADLSRADPAVRVRSS